MKNLLWVFGLLLLISSCKSDESNPVPPPLLDGSMNQVEKPEIKENSFRVSNGGSLSYILVKGIPSEGGPKITKQAEHFQKSEIRHMDSGTVYFYKPKTGFAGKDYVEITMSYSTGGGVYAKTIYKIKIEVVE